MRLELMMTLLYDNSICMSTVYIKVVYYVLINRVVVMLQLAFLI